MVVGRLSLDISRNFTEEAGYLIKLKQAFNLLLTIMKKLLARGGIEFLAVLLGISGSLWIDQSQDIRKQKNYQRTILESIHNDIIQTEKFFKDSRDLAFRADSIWMDYLSNNWDTMDAESVAIAMSKEKYTVFHAIFFDFREFHPPLSSIEMIMQDLSLIHI